MSRPAARLNPCLGHPRGFPVLPTNWAAGIAARVTAIRQRAIRQRAIRPYGSANVLFKAPALAMILPRNGSATVAGAGPEVFGPDAGAIWKASTD